MIKGLIEAAGGFFSFSVVLTENGFWPSRFFGIRTFWDDNKINDVLDSYGAEWTYEQRKTLERACQTGFYIGIIICQFGNLIICRTKRSSIFSHGFRNYRMVLAMIATLGLGCFLIYVPGLNTGLTLYPVKFLWWLSAIPFAIFVICHGEICKYLIRKFHGKWLSKELTF